METLHMPSPFEKDTERTVPDVSLFPDIGKQVLNNAVGFGINLGSLDGIVELNLEMPEHLRGIYLLKLKRGPDPYLAPMFLNHGLYDLTLAVKEEEWPAGEKEPIPLSFYQALNTSEIIQLAIGTWYAKSMQNYARSVKDFELVDGLKFEDLKRLSPEEVVDVLVRVGKQFGAANHAVGFTEHPTDSVSLKQRVRSLHPDTKTIAFYRLTGRKAVSQLENGEHPDFTEYGLSKWSNGRNTPESASFYRLNLTLHMGNTQRDLTPKTH